MAVCGENHQSLPMTGPLQSSYSAADDGCLLYSVSLPGGVHIELGQHVELKSGGFGQLSGLATKHVRICCEVRLYKRAQDLTNDPGLLASVPEVKSALIMTDEYVQLYATDLAGPTVILSTAQANKLGKAPGTFRLCNLYWLSVSKQFKDVSTAPVTLSTLFRSQIRPLQNPKKLRVKKVFLDCYWDGYAALGRLVN